MIALTSGAVASLTPIPDTPTPTPPSATPTITPTLAPFEQYTIDYLRQRSYGAGALEIVKTLETTDQFTHTLIRYTSDDLTMYGYMNIPIDDGQHPVVIIVHGLSDSGAFNSLTLKNNMAEALAQQGFLVILPILRGYPPSDSGDNMFRVGMSIDILNLIAEVKKQGGQPGALEKANPDHIGILGHSMGGDVVLHVLTVSSDIKAAVLYSSLSGNEDRNSQLLYRISLEPEFQNELNTLPSLFPRISPVYYYSNITAPIQLYHGLKDNTVPVSWARATCLYLSSAGKNINCIYYEDQGHLFNAAIREEFFASLSDFFKEYLVP